MRFRSVGMFSVLCAAILTLSACEYPTTSQGVRYSLIDGVAPARLFSVVSKNARSLPARSKTVGDQSAIVTYSGAGRDLITCTNPGSDINEGRAMLLDARTKIVVNGQKVVLETLYIATKRGAKSTRKSVAFSTAKSASFDDGLTCRATGKLEKTLLGQG